MIGLIAVVAIGSISRVGGQVDSLFTLTANKLTGSASGVSGGGSGSGGGAPTDTTSPTITTAVRVGTGNELVTNDTFSVSLTFDEDVIVTGLPQIGLTIGSQNRFFVYNAAASTANILQFDYIIDAADGPVTGAIMASNISLNGGNIADAASNAAILTFVAIDFSTLNFNVTPISCATILANNPSATTGFYTIDTDGTGTNPAFSAYCNMTVAGGGWTVLLSVDNATTRSQPYIENFDVTQNTIGNFTYIPSETCASSTGGGITWGGTATGFWETDNIELNIDYNEVYVTHSGFYNCPGSSLGRLFIGTSADINEWIDSTDSNANSSTGQSLVVQNTTIFFKQRIQIANRTDQLSVGAQTNIHIELGRFQSFAYSHRMIAQLWVC